MAPILQRIDQQKSAPNFQASAPMLTGPKYGTRQQQLQNLVNHPYLMVQPPRTIPQKDAYHSKLGIIPEATALINMPNPKHPYEEQTRGKYVPTRCGPSGLPSVQTPKIMGQPRYESPVRNFLQGPELLASHRISNELLPVNRGNHKLVLGRGTAEVHNSVKPLQPFPHFSDINRIGVSKSTLVETISEPLIDFSTNNGVDLNGNAFSKSKPSLSRNVMLVGCEHVPNQVPVCVTPNFPISASGQAATNLSIKSNAINHNGKHKPVIYSTSNHLQVDVGMKRTLIDREKFMECRGIGRDVSCPTATAALLAEKVSKSQWNMAACLVCLTAGGGVPLFTRKTADFKSLPFPIIGSLNGVHMFAKSHNVTLLSAATKETKIVWRDYYDSVTLIILTENDNACDSHLYEFLETAFYAMVLFIGMDDIINLKNIERLKRDLRSCFSIIDSLLMQLVSPNAELPLVGDAVQAADCLLCPESVALQGYLDSFVESAYSTYGCLLAHGRVIAASKKWWTLNGKEMALLSLYLATSQQATCRDVPVFLPVGSPKVPHRLLVFQLVQGIEVCTLCGPTPSLTQLEKEVGRFWKGAYELLKSTLQYRLMGLPTSITLDKSILGFIIVNNEERKCLCSVSPHGNSGDTHRQETQSAGSLMIPQQRLRILRSFYNMVIGSVFSEDSIEITEVLYKVID